MDNIFDDIDYYDNMFNLDLDIRRLEIPIPRRYLRDAQDPYAIDQQAFKIRYRFSQDTVKNFILRLIKVDLIKLNRRGLPIEPELQILICLRFYATASYQIVCGDLLNVSQPQISKIITKISNLLARRNKEFFKYPINMTNTRIEFTRLGQYNQYQGLHNIDGAIDCTHIKIVNTPGIEHHEVFRNRKSYFSVNVQAVVGPSGHFMDLVARWAGSTHDSRIFQMSRINVKYLQGYHTGKLVGDSGYPCLHYLLTPVNSPSNLAEETYNIVHIKTRNIIERTFGMWKRRFPCLHRGLGNKLSTVSDIIVACAVLYNISLRTNDATPTVDAETPYIDEPNVSIPNDAGTADGFATRAAIVNRFI